MTYPEHEKLHEVRKKSRELGELLEWLTHRKGISFAICREQTWAFAAFNIEEMLREYYGIDQAKLAQEQARMLAESDFSDGFDE